jgi:hypothetical protein
MAEDKVVTAEQGTGQVGHSHESSGERRSWGVQRCPMSGGQSPTTDLDPPYGSEFSLQIHSLPCVGTIPLSNLTSSSSQRNPGKPKAKPTFSAEKLPRAPSQAE